MSTTITFEPFYFRLKFQFEFLFISVLFFRWVRLLTVHLDMQRLFGQVRGRDRESPHHSIENFKWHLNGASSNPLFWRAISPYQERDDMSKMDASWHGIKIMAKKWANTRAPTLTHTHSSAWISFLLVWWQNNFTANLVICGADTSFLSLMFI